ncbi:MAG: F0F1 ATP synthase subunit B [bacterium]
MESIMNIDPGLIVWTLVNFGIFLFLILKLGTKPILNGLKARENKINDSIDAAEKAKSDAQKLLLETETKLSQAQKEMNEIIAKGREQAEKILQKASDESETVKRQKVEDAKNEIEKSKENAIKQLRSEVADLVVMATEKILDENLDKAKHYKMIEQYIEKLPNN